MTGQIKRTDLHPSIQGVFTEFEEGYTTTELSFEHVISNPDNAKEGMIKLNAKGRAIVNSVYNGNFKNGTDGWLVSNSTIQASDNVLSVTGTGSFSFVKTSQSIGRPEVGKRYFGRVVTRVTNDECRELIFQLGQGSNYGHIIKHHSEPEANIWYSLYGVIDITDQTELMLMISHSYSSKELSKDKVMEVKDVVLLDLDNHPDLQGLTAEQINERVPNYVDGVQGSDGLLVRSVGKNLFDSEWELGNILHTTGENAIANDRVRTVSFIPVKDDTDYVFSSDQSIGSEFWVYFYDRDKKYIGFINRTNGTENQKLRTPLSTRYLRIRTYNFTDVAKANTSLVQLEEGTEPTQYEPYQESYSFLTEGLYQLPNGVRDEIVDNRLIKRVDTTLVLDGSEDWQVVPFQDTVLPNSIYFRFPKPARMGVFWVGDSSKAIISTTFLNAGSSIYINDIEGIATDTTHFMVRIFKSRLPTPDVSGFKQWLSNNPQTVYYQLSEPKVKQLNLPINTYKNGHVMIEGWVNHNITKDDVKNMSSTQNKVVENAIVSFDHSKSTAWNSSKIDDVIVTNKKQFTDTSISSWNNKAYENMYFTSTSGNIGFILPLGIDIYKAKQLLEGTKVYYKLGSEYWVQPEWSVTYPTTLLSQINDNSKSISKLNEITQEHSDILATHGIRLDAMQGIVESGENANGRYVRFADGTQICISPSHPPEVRALANEVVKLIVTFPASFSAVPKTFADICNVHSSNKFVTNGFRANRNGFNTFELIVDLTITQTVNFDYIAIGRWK